MGKDAIGTRMKEDYEKRFQTHLMRRSYTMIRLDGKAFHTYTKDFKRPYDLGLMRIMDQTAIALCEKIQGAKLAYVQSDEITILITDFETRKTDAWFDSNVQKMVSISASIATAAFNNGMYLDEDILANMDKVAYFDSRVFQLPNREEVINALIWRQQDATRNSIQMGAQSMYSHKQLHGKNTSQLQELMFQKGQNWNDYPAGFKRGRIILKEIKETVNIQVFDAETSGLDRSQLLSVNLVKGGATIERNRWGSFEAPIFTQEKDFLRARIPKSEFEGE